MLTIVVGAVLLWIGASIVIAPIIGRAIRQLHPTDHQEIAEVLSHGRWDKL